MINIYDFFKRFAYSKTRWHLGKRDEALAVLLYGLPPIPKKPFRIRTPKGAQVEAEISKRVRTYDDALNKYGDIVLKSARDAKIPKDLALAFAWVESSFLSRSYRYEPNWDIYYINIKKSLPIDGPKYKPYKEERITIDEWFDQNEGRAREKRSGRDYSYWAQLRIASSYGLVQILYPTAVMEGFRGQPEDLYDPVICLKFGFKHYKRKLRKYKTQEKAIIAYNAGNCVKLLNGEWKNEYYLKKIRKAQAGFKKII